MKPVVKEISLAKFISRFKFVYGEQLKELTHDNVIKFYPDLRKTTFKNIKENPILLVKQEVFLVNDGHRTLPYYTPERIQDLDDYSEFLIETEEITIEDNIDYLSMTNYELKKLLRSKFSTKKIKSNAKKELENRGVILRKKYNRKKDLKMEDEYEGY